jgi:hypothetical protein
MTFKRSAAIARVGGDDLDQAQAEVVSGAWDFTGGLKENGRDVAGVGSLMAKAAALVDRLSRHDYDPFATLTADAPTVTIGTSGTLTGRTVGPWTGEITEAGSRGTWSSTFGRLPVAGASGLDFFHTGTAVEIMLFGGVTTSALPVWIFVNGQPVAATPASLGSVTSSTSYYVKLTFGSSKRRRIEFYYPHSGSWFGEAVAAVWLTALSKLTSEVLLLTHSGLLHANRLLLGSATRSSAAATVRRYCSSSPPTGVAGQGLVTGRVG